MIYVMHPDISRFKSFVIDSKEARRKLGSDTMFHFDQRPLAYLNVWQPLEIEFAKLSSSRKLSLPDVVVRDGRMFLNKTSYEVLYDLLKGCGEFLPITYGGEKGYLFNILSLADACGGLNKKLSTKDQYGDIQSLAFYEEVLQSMPVFRTEFDRYMGIYCTENFKHKFEDAGLCGIIFSNDLGNIFPPDNMAEKPTRH